MSKNVKPRGGDKAADSGAQAFYQQELVHSVPCGFTEKSQDVLLEADVDSPLAGQMSPSALCRSLSVPHQQKLH